MRASAQHQLNGQHRGSVECVLNDDVARGRLLHRIDLRARDDLVGEIGPSKWIRWGRLLGLVEAGAIHGYWSAQLVNCRAIANGNASRSVVVGQFEISRMHQYRERPNFLHFSSIQRARARLSKLHDLGVVWRSRPRAMLGSLPWHYTLDEIGAWIVAENLGIDRHLVSYRQDRTRALVDSPRLEHTRAANSFFTRLYHVAHTTQGPLRVAEWRGEEWCARRWENHVRPDGFARIDFTEGWLELLLELDMGTERLSRLEAKMERYRIMAKAATAPDVVLFCFPTAGREVSARPALGGSPMPVATATLDRHLSNPLGPNWLLVDGDRRLRVSDLPRRGMA
jgi:hypothetical protein